MINTKIIIDLIINRDIEILLFKIMHITNTPLNNKTIIIDLIINKTIIIKIIVQ